MDRFVGIDEHSAVARRLVELSDALTAATSAVAPADSVGAAEAALERLAGALHDDVEVWQSLSPGGRRIPKRHVIAGVRAMRRALDGYRYTDIERLFHPDGFVQTHVLRGRTRTGVEIAADVAVWVDVEDGLVVRAREYLDSAAVRALAL